MKIWISINFLTYFHLIWQLKKLYFWNNLPTLSLVCLWHPSWCQSYKTQNNLKLHNNWFFRSKRDYFVIRQILICSKNTLAHHCKITIKWSSFIGLNPWMIFLWKNIFVGKKGCLHKKLGPISWFNLPEFVFHLQANRGRRKS